MYPSRRAGAVAPIGWAEANVYFFLDILAEEGGSIPTSKILLGTFRPKRHTPSYSAFRTELVRVRSVRRPKRRHTWEGFCVDVGETRLHRRVRRGGRRAQDPM